MPGTYNGGDFTLGKDASLGDIFRIQEQQDAQAARNIAAWAGVSEADLNRAVQGDSPRQSGGVPTSGAGPGAGLAASVRKPVVTGGPAAGTVGASGSVGPGARIVYSAPTKWTPGGAMNFGGHALEMARETKITPITIGGYDVQHDRGWSDAGAVEQRYGDTDFMSPAWFYNWGVTAADAIKSGPGMVTAGVAAIMADGARVGHELVTKGPGVVSTVNGALDAYTKKLAAQQAADPFGGTAPTIVLDQGSPIGWR